MFPEEGNLEPSDRQSLTLRVIIVHYLGTDIISVLLFEEPARPPHLK
jgi:hypothetical protein